MQIHTLIPYIINDLINHLHQNFFVLPDGHICITCDLPRSRDLRAHPHTPGRYPRSSPKVSEGNYFFVRVKSRVSFQGMWAKSLKGGCALVYHRNSSWSKAQGSAPKRCLFHDTSKLLYICIVWFPPKWAISWSLKNAQYDIAFLGDPGSLFTILPIYIYVLLGNLQFAVWLTTNCTFFKGSPFPYDSH